MQRHPSLIPISHEHHRALAQALFLRRAAEADAEAREAAVLEYLAFVGAELVPHMGREEANVFPLVLGDDEGREVVARLVAEHERLIELSHRLALEQETAATRPETLREIGELLNEHVRLEERVLLPLAERLMSDEDLEAIGHSFCEGYCDCARGRSA